MPLAIRAGEPSTRAVVIGEAAEAGASHGVRNGVGAPECVRAEVRASANGDTGGLASVPQIASSSACCRSASNEDDTLLLIAPWASVRGARRASAAPSRSEGVPSCGPLRTPRLDAPRGVVGFAEQ